MDWLTFASSIIVAGLTGAAASLLAPWSQWGVEKRKLIFHERKKLVSSCRKMLHDYENRDIDDFRDKIEYLDLKTKLDNDIVLKLDKPLSKTITVNISGNEATSDRGQIEKIQILTEELRKLEDKWKLI